MDLWYFIHTFCGINELLELLSIAGGWCTLLIAIVGVGATVGAGGLRLFLGQAGRIQQLLNERVEETVRHRKNVEFLEGDFLRPPTFEERVQALTGEQLAKAIAAAAEFEEK